MIIELLSIGDELLKGITVNSNAVFLSRHLKQHGYSLSRQTTLPDQRDSLHAGLKEALERADLVIATGGLGPTLDDHTRQVAAQLFDSEFHFDSNIAEDIKRRFGNAIASTEDQATIPSKAKPLHNRYGTAPGLVFSAKEKTLILLPGVPREMEPMFLEQVLPWLEKHWPVQQQKQIEQLCFCLIYESLIDPHLRELSKRYPSVEAGIYPAHGTVSVCLQSSDKQQLFLFRKELLSQFDEYHYLAPSGKIEEAVHNWFTEHKRTLAFAESCTGGMLATLITSQPGASNYFLGSIVAYADVWKEQLLGVSTQTLAEHGAVSTEVVREMLQGTFDRTNADFAIAVSGIAGPDGGSVEKPVGTIWAAIGERGKAPDVGTFRAKGSRQTIIFSTANHLLGALWRKVDKKIPAFPFLRQS